eukprot:71900-Amphidinium_carterae.2
MCICQPISSKGELYRSAQHHPDQHTLTWSTAPSPDSTLKTTACVALTKVPLLLLAQELLVLDLDQVLVMEASFGHSIPLVTTRGSTIGQLPFAQHTIDQCLSHMPGGHGAHRKGHTRCVWHDTSPNLCWL